MFRIVTWMFFISIRWSLLNSRLKYNTGGELECAGFASPNDADYSDVVLWMPGESVSEPLMSTKQALYIISNVGSGFCDLIEQEKNALLQHDNAGTSWVCWS